MHTIQKPYTNIFFKKTLQTKKNKQYKHLRKRNKKIKTYEQWRKYNHLTKPHKTIKKPYTQFKQPYILS